MKNKSEDTRIDISFALLALFSLGISPIYNTFLFALPVITILFTCYYVTKLNLPNSDLYQYVGSANFAFFTALLIYQMHGMIEMHFLAFIGAIILIQYKNWKLLLPITLIVVLHHVILNYLQFSGNKEIYFTTEDYMDIQTFGIHMILASIIFFLCGFWAHIFKKQADEILEKSSSLETQINTTNSNIKIANEIANGNLETKIEINDDDELGKALVIMQKNLTTAKIRESEEKFYNVGLAQASEILRNQNDDLVALSSNFLHYLIKYLHANQGGIFILDNTDKKNMFLKQMACYAYERKKLSQKVIHLEEGLIGACYQEKDIIYMTDVPKSYVSITSGLGQDTPRAILIAPIMVNEIVYGIIEMAFFETLEPYKIEFTKKVLENLASSISTVKTNEQTKSLLEISQQQTEALRAQEEEMRQNMEEMNATQEEMTRKQAELTQLLEESRLMEERMKMQEEMMQQGMEELMTTQEEMEIKNKEIEKYSVKIMVEKEEQEAKIEMLTLKLKKKEKELEELIKQKLNIHSN